MKIQQVVALLLFFTIGLGYTEVQGQGIEYDGVYIVQKDGKAVQLERSTAKLGHYVTNMFTSFWKFPKKYFTLEDKIIGVSSFKKIVLKGVEYDATCFKNLQLLEMKQVKLGMPFFHSGKQTVWKDGQLAYMQNTDSGFYYWGELKKNSKSELYKEATIDVTFESGKVYAFWVNSGYYLFEVR